jgi:hypothetical protein
MTTANDVVFAALRKLRVVDAQGTVDPSDFVTAVEMLNDMLTRWEADGTSMGWSNVKAPEDVCNFPDEAKLAVVYNLTLFLAPEYGRDIDPAVANAAVAMKKALDRDVFVANPLRAGCNGAPMPDAGSGSRYNIYSDSYRRW